METKRVMYIVSDRHTRTRAGRVLLWAPAVLGVLLACKGGAKDQGAPPPAPVETKPTPVETKPTLPPEVTISPRPIPPGFDFPGNREDIQAWADAWEIAKIQTKAWNLWGGLTTSSGQIWAGSELPIWETWCGTEEAFAKTCNDRVRPGRDFINATQLGHSAPKDVDPGLRLAAFNKFDPSMTAYLAAQHEGPGNASYDYTSQESLAALNAAWPAGTSIADRKVKDAPYEPPASGGPGAAAVELKPVLFLVKQKGLTPVPLWRGIADAKPDKNSDCASGPNDKCHPDPTLWYTCVLVDPAGKAAAPDTKPVPATPEQIAAANQNPDFSCKSEQYLYAPLSTLYSFQVDAAEAADFNKVQAEAGAQAEAGDYAVLTAMHVNTKEIVDWTWQTFWWQPGEDAPNDFPGSKKGMTDKVAGAWRNYGMCTAYGQTKGKASKDMVVCFNPYLETSSGIPDGVQSNCMSCHGTATVGAIQNGSISTLDYPSSYTAPIDFNTDPRFATFTQTDFSWAIPVNSQPPPSGAK